MGRAVAWPAALLLAAAAALGGAAHTAAASCPALDYQARLTAAAATLQQAPPDVAGAERAVSALLAADPGRAVALQPVLADLSSSPPEVSDAQLRLSSMSAALAYPHGSVCNENADAARSALHSVYASPDFRHLDEGTQPGLLESIVSAIANLLGRGAGVLGPVGAGLLAAVVVGTCLLLAWRRWRGSAAVRDAALAEPATAGDDPDVEWRLAEGAAAAGDHREAVRRAFRSALLEVALSGGARIDAAWTTRELLQRIDAGGDVLAALAGAAALFERAWYAAAPVTTADWTRAAERCAAVRRLARAAGRVAR